MIWWFKKRKERRMTVTIDNLPEMKEISDIQRRVWALEQWVHATELGEREDTGRELD